MRKYLIFFLLFIGVGLLPVQGQLKIIPLGNSITQGNSTQGSYRKALWDLFQINGINVDFVGSLNQPNDCGAWPDPAFDQDHEGHWGWTVDQILDGTGSGGPWNCRVDVLGNDISDWLVGIVPDVALVHLGTNDMILSQNPANTITEIGAVIDALRVANPAIKVYLALLIPSGFGSYNTRINSLNVLIPAFVTSKTTSGSPVYLVDQNTGFNPVTDTYDDIHPNNIGEQKMAQNWYNALVSTLPVGLTSLNAQTKDGIIDLIWETAWELNNKEFEVEHWNERKEIYEKIGFVPGSGTIESQSSYNFRAGKFPKGSHVFRLKQIDFDGKFSYSRSLQEEIEASPINQVQLYPIPAQTYLMLNFPFTTRKGQNIQIFDMQGKLVHAEQIPARVEQHRIAVNKLSPGLYILEIERYNGTREQHKFSMNLE